MRAVIFWNKHQYQDIIETEFSFNFCYRSNKKAVLENHFVDFEWIDILPDQTLKSVKVDGNVDYYILINDPELIFSIDIIKAMIFTSKEQQLAATVPVYNESFQVSQNAQLDLPYVNYTSYLEIAEKYLSQHKQEKTLQQLPLNEADNSLLCLSCEEFNKISADYTLEQVFLLHKTQVTILDNMLIHRFGNYYAGYRDDLLKLIPANVKTVLDVGCARGFFGKHVKRQRPDINITGVEMNPLMAKEATEHYDRILNQTIESITIDEQFDHINCGDILEHLENPWSVVSHLYQLLKTGGTFVASVPNAGHWSIVKELSEGKFQYIPVGLLCVTHIRWFTQTSLRETFENTGFEILKIDKQQLPATPQGEKFIQHLASFSKDINIDSLRTNELTIVAKKTSARTKT